MRPLLAVYAVTALLLAAGVGPASQAVRDASLGEIEDLEEPRSLGEFGFLKVLRPYLPPLVVDWIVVKRTAYLDIPDDADLKVDPDGRFVLVWPEGCEETYDKERGGGRGPDCPEPPEDPCAGADGNISAPPACRPCDDGGTAEDHGGTCPEEVVCPDGHDKRIQDDGSVACIKQECPDGEGNGSTASEEAASSHDGCTASIPPPGACPDDTVRAYDDTCVPAGKHRLWHRGLAGSRDGDDPLVVDIELKVPYRVLFLNITHTNQTQGASWSFNLTRTDGFQVCWSRDTDPCDGTAAGSASDTFPDERPVSEHWTGDLPEARPGQAEGNFTIHVEYTKARFPAAQPRIQFVLEGIPEDDPED